MSAVSILALAAGILFLLLIPVVYISCILVELNDAKATIKKLCYYHRGDCGEYPECVSCPFADKCYLGQGEQKRRAK